MCPNRSWQTPLSCASLIVALWSLALPDDASTVGRSKQDFAGAKAGQLRDDNGIAMKMIWCPPGKFRMGSPKGEAGRSDGEDQVPVTLTKGFWLGKYEVTQREWRSVMHTSPWNGKEH